MTDKPLSLREEIDKLCPCMVPPGCPCHWGGSSDGSRVSCACSIARVKEAHRNGPNHTIYPCNWPGHALSVRVGDMAQEVARLCDFRNRVNDALNMGDGVYRP